MPAMNFNEFTKYVSETIKGYLPSEYQDGIVAVEPVRKLGSSYTGLTVRVSGMRATPTINLEQYYKEFVKGSEAKLLMREMAQVILTHSLGADYEWIADYEKAKDRLFIRVSNAARNGQMLESVPHQIKEDLVMTCHVLVSKDRGIASTVVNDNLMKAYGITEDRLFKDAIDNSQKLFPIKIQSLEAMIFDMASEEGLEAPESNKNNMLVVTNDQTINGAAALFYPEAMEKIADMIDGDYYVIPSSIHECLVVPESVNVSYQHLESMLQEVNSAMVAVEEQLSDHIYHYDSTDKTFELAEDYAYRLQNENQLSAVMAA